MARDAAQTVHSSMIGEETIKPEIGKGNVFGKELILDLIDCDPSVLQSREKIEQFAAELCQVIDMEPYGAPFVGRFGFGKDFTAGYSLVQLIESSSITGHFSDLWRRAYLEIFSCKEYDADEAVAFSQRFFRADGARQRVIYR